jgi:hypothetical protein
MGYLLDAAFFLVFAVVLIATGASEEKLVAPDTLILGALICGGLAWRAARRH